MSAHGHGFPSIAHALKPETRNPNQVEHASGQCVCVYVCVCLNQVEHACCK